ncbi:uncharacterized protein [Euphorbia lathyris]|uniref:uncharacterized protein n=1 Tax=Euphorbia lathyris TaxID=212925 RepID=UPI003313272F
MDIEDWEILPHGGFLDYHQDDGEKSNRSSSNPKSKFNMNYFVCPSSPPRMLQSNRVVPVPFQLEPISVSPGEDGMNMPEIKGPDLVLVKEIDDDQDPISQVFFKKMSENEFVDMKMDSPKSPTKDKGEILDTNICSPRIKGNMKVEGGDDDEVNWEENGGGLNLWKWSLSGIGAICSFGVAAATVCVIIFGSQQRSKQRDHNQKLRFQIYADDKRIKQVVHHATRLNEAITAVRGVPIARAHITYGGYYESL